jgi:histidinol-phosphate/aromatic aminotransferase/cobyric acid decarboxylase-like protein/choline kinase
MQSIILAAGMGKRLKQLTRNNTKCMVPVNGVTLAERMLRQLDRLGLERIVIVVGYKGKELQSYVSSLSLQTPLLFIENKVYDKTNNIYSLYLASKELAEDDTLLLESDLIFDDGILEYLLHAPDPNLALVSKYEEWMDGTMLTLAEKGTITGFIGKDAFYFPDANRYYKTVNVYKFSAVFSKRFYLPFLEAYSKSIGNNEYYEQVLKVISSINNTELKALVLPKSYKWYEIDDIQDLDIAETLFQEDPSKKYDMICSRYGGFWRFPQLIDFCYLVNPYYPPSAMMEELKASFENLIRSYPSGLRVNSLLASKYYGVLIDEIVVGNGAAELIRSLMQSLEGIVGVISPSFDEYRNRLDDGRLVVFDTSLQGYRYTADDLISYFSSKGISSLALINPDNPSGNYLVHADVLRLLAWAKEKGILLIVDESFDDFADERDNCLIDSAVLESNPHLVVVKSISKSFGVPGLRLGVLASGDKALMKHIKSDVSIWNINSFAEYYLQICEKYRSAYTEALASIKADRKSFLTALSSILQLRVLPSEANYFMCEVRNGTARELAVWLLQEHHMLIKVLTGKHGIKGEYIRLAVRTKEENDRLCEALSEWFCPKG